MKYESNGMQVVDRLLREHGVIAPDETWVHGMWTPDKWWRCLRAKIRGRKLVRMTHGSLSPVSLERQGKVRKRLVAPIERFLFRICDRVAVTGPWEQAWCEQWGVKGPFQIVDLKAFFDLSAATSSKSPYLVHSGRGEDSASTELHILYLGRRHPLKGIRYLERAVEELNHHSPTPTLNSNSAPTPTRDSNSFTLRLVSDHIGEELERDWAWCDVLCLPSLSENFGLVVAEALARGKRVVTTDGAPAWDPSVTGTDYGGRLVYLRGYRDGTDAARAEGLKRSLISQSRPLTQRSVVRRSPAHHAETQEISPCCA